MSHDVEILSDKITTKNSIKKQDISSLGGALNKYADTSKIHLPVWVQNRVSEIINEIH